MRLGLANQRRRVRAIFVVTLFVFSLFAAQLVRLQGIDAADIAAKGRDLRTGGKAKIIPAKRGTVEDRYGVPLATTVSRRDVVVDQKAVAGYTKRDPATKKRVEVGAAGAAADLAPLLRRPEDELRTELTGTAPWRPIARRVEPTLWRKIEALRIPGISSEDVPVRTYPGGEPTAPLVGFVGPDGSAPPGTGGGLERRFDDMLTGTPGRMLQEYSLDQRVIPMARADVVPAVPGRNLRLTIDNDLQWYAYDAIAQQVRQMGAKSGYVVVMDRQGRLRAVAQYPGFDPAQRGRPGDVLGSLPFQDSFEPGSTAKVMSIGAALAEGLTTPTTLYTVPWTMNIPNTGGKPFRDSHKHDVEKLTTAGILAKSSNVGTILATQGLSREKIEDYYRRFGARSISHVSYPGETQGLLYPAKSWDGRQRYTILFGQGMAMSAIQDIGVFQTIANGGVRVPASIVAGETKPDGSYEPAPTPDGVQAVSPQVAQDLNRMLQSVVTEAGTAQAAAIPGVVVAGKTGTSEKIGSKPEGGRQPYTSSFVGYAPADDPQYIVAVIVQEPGKGKPIYGGTVAGPVFRSVMAYALKSVRVDPSAATPRLFPLDEKELSTGAPTPDPSGTIPTRPATPPWGASAGVPQVSAPDRTAAGTAGSAPGRPAR